MLFRSAWHLEYAKYGHDDRLLVEEKRLRRHKSRCYFHSADDICRNKRIGCYNVKCGGSNHCAGYKEVKYMSDYELEGRKKLTEKNKAIFEMKAQLEKNNLAFHYLKYEEMDKCPLCENDLYERWLFRKPVKECSACGATFMLGEIRESQIWENFFWFQEMIIDGVSMSWKNQKIEKKKQLIKKN